jgi:hypothetical protein
MYPSVSAIARMAMTSRLAILVLVSALLLPLGATADSWYANGSAQVGFYIWTVNNHARGIAVSSLYPSGYSVGDLQIPPLAPGVYSAKNGARVTVVSADQIEAFMLSDPSQPSTYADLQALQPFKGRTTTGLFTLTVQALLGCSTGDSWGPQISFGGTGFKSSRVANCPGNYGVVNKSVGYYVASL